MTDDEVTCEGFLSNALDEMMDEATERWGADEVQAAFTRILIAHDVFDDPDLDP